MRIVFTDPSGSFDHLDETLESALRSLIRKARHTIDIHGYSLAAFYDSEIFDRDIVPRLESGARLRVYGHVESEARKVAGVFSRIRSPPECYFWSGGGLYHIKAIVVDSRYVYIGSANISRAAMRENAEWGAIYESNEVASEIERYTEHLVETGLLVRLA